MKYQVFYEGSRCICPVCGGLVYGDEEEKTCLDCKRKFSPVREGESEREMVLEDKTA